MLDQIEKFEAKIDEPIAADPRWLLPACVCQPGFRQAGILLEKNEIHDLNRVPGRSDTKPDIYRLHNSSHRECL